MLPGLVEVNSNVFYSDIWPRIRDEIEIVESNRESWGGTEISFYPVIIKWGYKDNTEEKIILAITRSDDTEEKYWVVSSLLQNV